MCGVVLGEPVGTVDEVDRRSRVDAPQAAEIGSGESVAARSARRMEFVDGWVPRLFSLIDSELDEPTRRRIMAANGRACFAANQPHVSRRATPATLEEIRAWVAQRSKAGCLCPAAEAQTPRTISRNYCWCSVGYVKEMHERVFGRQVDAELLQSVLRGDPSCRFRITIV
jgi:hypothetical protein